MKNYLRLSLVKLGKALISLGQIDNDYLEYDPKSPYGIAYGATLIREALLRNPGIIDTIIVMDKDLREYFSAEAVELATNLGKEIIYENSDRLLRKNWKNFSILGKYRKWEDHLEEGNHVVLVNPTMRGNIGNVVRSCAALGVNNIAVIAENFDSFLPEIIRTSMGTRFLVHMERFSDIQEYMERFPGNNRYAFMLDKTAERLNSVEKKENWTLFFGNETVGLPQEYGQLCRKVYIEIKGNVDSLNLGVAASIAIHAFTE
jgi:tRNA G18 (ribose-2'-O)-methylase SpoU